MGVIQEFKQFAMRGNVVDMSVGIIIGGAFGTVVKSLVDDVIMPPVGILTSGVDFKRLTWQLKPVAGEVPAVTLNYGAFINNVITFLIVAWAVFLLVKAINAARSTLDPESAAAAAPPPPEDVLLLRQIRDAVQKK